MQLPEYLKNVITNKKVLIPAVVVILIMEGIWAYSVIYKDSKQPQTGSSSSLSSGASAAPVSAPKAILTLQAPKDTLKVGEKIAVSINITSSKLSDGTDVVMTYDPGKLVVEPVKNAAMAPGAIYSDYPINEVDAASGKITISGITSSTGGVKATGLFGVINFVAKSPGKTLLKVDFTPGSSADSNVVETKTAKDLLGQVNNLEVTITP